MSPLSINFSVTEIRNSNLFIPYLIQTLLKVLRVWSEKGNGVLAVRWSVLWPMKVDTAAYLGCFVFA